MNDELSYIYYAFSIISYFQMNVVFLFEFPIPQRDVSFDYPPYFGSYSKKTGGRFHVPLQFCTLTSQQRCQSQDRR